MTYSYIIKNKPFILYKLYNFTNIKYSCDVQSGRSWRYKWCMLRESPSIVLIQQKHLLNNTLINSLLLSAYSKYPLGRNGDLLEPRKKPIVWSQAYPTVLIYNKKEELITHTFVESLQKTLNRLGLIYKCFWIRVGKLTIKCMVIVRTSNILENVQIGMYSRARTSTTLKW